MIKTVLIENYDGSKQKIDIPFTTHKYNKGKLRITEPTKSARTILNQFKSWEVLGDAFKHKSIYSVRANCVLCNHPSTKISDDGICEYCL